MPNTTSMVIDTSEPFDTKQPAVVGSIYRSIEDIPDTIHVIYWIGHSAFHESVYFTSAESFDEKKYFGSNNKLRLGCLYRKVTSKVEYVWSDEIGCVDNIVYIENERDDTSSEEENIEDYDEEYDDDEEEEENDDEEDDESKKDQAEFIRLTNLLETNFRKVSITNNKYAEENIKDYARECCLLVRRHIGWLIVNNYKLLNYLKGPETKTEEKNSVGADNYNSIDGKGIYDVLLTYLKGAYQNSIQAKSHGSEHESFVSFVAYEPDSTNLSFDTEYPMIWHIEIKQKQWKYGTGSYDGEIFGGKKRNVRTGGNDLTGKLYGVFESPLLAIPSLEVYNYIAAFNSKNPAYAIDIEVSGSFRYKEGDHGDLGITGADPNRMKDIEHIKNAISEGRVHVHERISDDKILNFACTITDKHTQATKETYNKLIETTQKTLSFMKEVVIAYVSHTQSKLLEQQATYPEITQEEFSELQKIIIDRF